MTDRLHLLATAEVDIEGRMPWSSNATFLVNLSVDQQPVGQAIYKPLRGERPLWDFEPGLHRRELAAFLLSEAMGIELVPPTIIRDGPLGEGSMQWFVEADHQQHYFTIYEARADLHHVMREVALFDILANNTEFKLRTVVWEFGGETMTDDLLATAAKIAERVPLEVSALLNDEEAAAIQERAQWVVEHRVFPVDNSGRRYPWPLV